MSRLALGLAAMALLSLPARGQDAAPITSEVRAVWITRWDYKRPDDVRRIVDDCADLGANRILFQVRGASATCYPSRLEPWDPFLGGGDPGWDPLAVVVEAAAARGLAVEAWINAMPLWRGTEDCTDPHHPYKLHPEWVVVGSDGQPQRRTAHYVCANPALPAVRAHVAAIAAELARGWAIDAVHLDYVRYVTDLEARLDFSYDETSLAAFGKDPRLEPAAWARFKADQVTAVVREVRAAIRAARPGCRLTAAVYPTRASRAKVSQDVEGWIDAGLIDAVYPMTYAAERVEATKRFDDAMAIGLVDRLAPVANPDGARRVPVIPGVGTFQHVDAAETTAQLELLRARGAAGAALFCYSALFESSDRGELHEPRAALREARAAAVRALWR